MYTNIRYLKQTQRETLRKPSEQPAFYCMFRMLMSVIATDYNRVVCIRQTRNDEEVTDWWKWWAIIFLYLKKAGKRKYRVHFQRNKRKREKLLQNESTVTAPLCPPSPLLSLPPSPSIWKKKRSVVWEGERGGRNDSGLDGWWWMKQWRFSSGASVWCWGIWCHTAAVCRTSVWPACCAWFDSFATTLVIKIYVSWCQTKCVLPTWHGCEGHIFDAEWS